MIHTSNTYVPCFLEPHDIYVVLVYFGLLYSSQYYLYKLESKQHRVERMVGAVPLTINRVQSALRLSGLSTGPLQARERRKSRNSKHAACLIDVIVMRDTDSRVLVKSW